MPLKFKDKVWADGRLRETYVLNRKTGKLEMYGGRAPGGDVVFNKKNGEQEIVDYEDMDITPQTLGMCQYDFHALYIERIPKRRDWRQGHRMANSSVTFVSGPHLRVKDWKVLTQFPNPEYSKLGEAMEKVQDRFKSVAISPEFAIREDGDLMYKSFAHPVGNVNRRTLKMSLNDKHHWLEEVFQEVMAKGA